MFISDIENKVSKEYLEKGYVVQDIIQLDELNWIRDNFCKILKEKLPNLKENTPESILNNIHKYIKLAELNKFRLDVINKINLTKNFFDPIFLCNALTFVLILFGISGIFTNPSVSALKYKPAPPTTIGVFPFFHCSSIFSITILSQ